MDQLPVCLNLKGRKVVVTGGGAAARLKADTALRAGADVLVVAPELGSEFEEIDGHPRLMVRLGNPAAFDLADTVLVFAASDDPVANEATRRLAAQAHVLAHVNEEPAASDFSMPSIIDRSPLVIAISSAGTSPLLGRLLRQRLEAVIPASFGNLARFLGDIRGRLVERLPEVGQRRRFLERVLDGTVADLVLSGDEPRARREIEAQADAFLADSASRQGEVYLVGGGPGDPDLLTFRALRLMQRADVVVYDRLVGSPILDLVRRDAERVYVGKRRNEHTLAQEEISQLLVNLAKQGKRVLRLKGGDPFIFGRGGEEIELLAAEGIPFQIVPGVTAASGCASFAGIPLTHRDHAQSCVFVTGHTKTGRLSAEWSTVLQPNQTVVIYMGLAYLADLMTDFLANGANPDMPVAIVENGTRPNQRVLTGTIADIAGKAAGAGITGPALTIIGTVVSLRDKLAWYAEPQPGFAPVAASLSAGTEGHPGPDQRARPGLIDADPARG
ncbi:MAG: siroheme synthase CysG [Hyphomicrobiaceae bacterium]|nr:siroheme synthase CysG [Hyphomicrobiaceae bacterium]